MKQIFKLFIVKDEPYLTVDENVVIGDIAIVTVGEQFPSVVECKNDEQIKLIQDSKLSLTKRHKVVMKPNELEELKKLNKTKLTKMRLEELYKIVDKLKIIITAKNTTKSVIIEAILLKLSNFNYK